MVGPLFARGDRHVADIAVAVGAGLEARVLVAFDERLGEAVGAGVREVEQAVLASTALEDGLLVLLCSILSRSGGGARRRGGGDWCAGGARGRGQPRRATRRGIGIDFALLARGT